MTVQARVVEGNSGSGGEGGADDGGLMGAAAQFPGLEQAIREADAEAFLVEPRVLRRVIRNDRDVQLLDWHGTHRRWYAIWGSRAAEFLDREELGLPASSAWPEMLLLLGRPGEEEVQETAPEQLRRQYWRLLFGARVVATMLRSYERGLDEAGLRQRVDELGQAVFDEVRSVLVQEHLIQDKRDLKSSYAEFAALYLELRFFFPELVASYFPSLVKPERVDAILARDVDAEGIFAATKLAGSAGRTVESEGTNGDVQYEPGHEADPAEERGLHRWLLRKAIGASRRGNQVRAAITLYRAAQHVPAGRESATRESARREITRLCERLRPALGLTNVEVAEWARALLPLLERASGRNWSPETRLLYELQKVALDQEREVYELNVGSWLMSLGKRPLKVPLPFHRDVRIVNHLRSAQRRLPKVVLTKAEREELTGRLDRAVAASTRRLRESMRPVIQQTLEACGWKAENVPEAIACKKMVEELLDKVEEIGFLGMSDLRDAVARNQLKLGDLSNPVELLSGDRLLKTDKALAMELPGVYRRGEFYLRELQRANSVVFGTRTGRFLSLYLALPVCGAFVILEGTEHLINPVLRRVGTSKVHLVETPNMLVLGLFLLGIVVSEWFRDQAWSLTRQAGHLVTWPIVGFPRWLKRQWWFQAISRSWWFRLGVRWVGKPLVFGLATWGVLRALGVVEFDSIVLAGISSLMSALLLNSRTGRDFEEIVADRAVRFGSWLGRDLLPGLFRMVMDIFDRSVEWVERVMYGIDEWLRFRSGQRRLGLITRVMVLPLWGMLTYMVRFLVRLVIEPQVNPIKHFPVVTVAHKALLPIILGTYKAIQQPPLGLDRDTAGIIVFLMQFIVPGICGFLVWELRENWRLYRANRPWSVRPQAVGHHGETVGRLLRYGFHSGTVPKLYGRLRRARKQESESVASRRSPARRHREGLHHAEQAMERFVEREFVEYLRASRYFEGVVFELAAVSLGVNRAGFELLGQGANVRGRLRVAFEEQSGWLVAGVEDGSMLESLTVVQRETLRDALTGLYKLAGVDLVREQVETWLGASRFGYDIADEGLVVWPRRDYGEQVLYALESWYGGEYEEEELGQSGGMAGGESGAAWPGSEEGTGESGGMARDASRLQLSRRPLPWRRWVAIWERDEAGDGHPEAAIPGLTVLAGSIKS